MLNAQGMNASEFAVAAWQFITDLENTAYHQHDMWHRDQIIAPNGRMIEVKAIRAVNNVMIVEGVDGTYKFLHVVKQPAFAEVMRLAGFVKKAQ